MHRCLTILDIQRMIFSFFTDEDQPSRVGNAALINMAIACRSFQEAALDTLWHTQNSFVPLIKALPGDLWEEEPSSGFERTLKLTRAVKESDFLRFDFYACRIRFLNYKPYPWYKESITPFDIQACYTLWQHRHEQPLLPGLRRLIFNHQCGSFVPPRMLLSPILLAVVLDWDSPGRQGKELFTDLLSTCRDLQELHLGVATKIDKPARSEFSKLVRGCGRLRQLSCGSNAVDITAIRHLALLPDFHVAQFADATAIADSLSSVPPQQIFPALKKLTFMRPELGSVTTLLQCMTSHNLQSVTLACDDAFGPKDMEQFFLALRHRASLDEFYSCQVIRSHNSRKAAVLPNIVLDAATFSSVRDFRNLTVFEIDNMCAIDLDDDAIASMARAWPKLERLQLGPMLGWGTSSKVTLQGLHSLSTCCPALERLVISIDASGPTPRITTDGVRFNLRLSYLQIGQSLIGDPAAVATYLSTIFPNVLGIGGLWLYMTPRDLPEDVLETHRRWQLVFSALVAKHSEIRRRQVV